MSITISLSPLQITALVAIVVSGIALVIQGANFAGNLFMVLARLRDSSDETDGSEQFLSRVSNLAAVIAIITAGYGVATHGGWFFLIIMGLAAIRLLFSVR